jgi:hypothetical protein
MKNDFGLEFYVYTQLLQVVVHKQMLFASLETSSCFQTDGTHMSPYFFTIQHKSKMFNDIKL